MNVDREAWVEGLVRAEKVNLLYSVSRAMTEIAKATPLQGDVGDEYDRARAGLRVLQDRLLAELPEYQHQAPTIL